MSNEMKDWLYNNKQEEQLLCKTVEQRAVDRSTRRRLIMRWHVNKINPNEPYIIEKFALFPICIQGEYRWLERVKIQAHYWWIDDCSGEKYVKYDKFIDD